MALALLGFPTIVRSRIGTIEIDATLSELHTYSADITENPVEDGIIFSDHIVLKPVVLEMEGRISDATQSLLAFRGPGTADAAFKKLINLQTSRETFEVRTATNVYKNMMFEELSIPREERDGRSIRFTAVLKEILVVSDEAATNRERIAADVRPSALPSRSDGIVSKVLT